MTATAEIEAALAAAWTLDNLAVYGDHLQQLGDPRGELIAVDLHVARHGSSPEIQHRRRRAIRAWLGLEDKVDPTRGLWESVKFSFGFVDDLRIELATRILNSPAGPYVRGITLAQKARAMAWLLHEIGRAPRPWLERLTISPPNTRLTPSVWNGEYPALPIPAIEKLITASPRLSRLEIAGHHLLQTFPHPALRSLRVDGIDASLSILRPGPPMPAVTELELSFARAPGWPVLMQRPWPTLVPAESFPVLRRLDLSANDIQRANTDTQLDLFDVLLQIGVLGQLDELRLPAIRNPHEATVVREVMARMPRLRRLELVRGFGENVLERDGVEVVAVDVPWPRWNEPVACGPVLVRCATRERNAIELDPRQMIRICERDFRWFDDAAREAWTVIWQTIGGLVLSNIPAQIPSSVLRTALEAVGFLDASFPELRPWVALRELLRELVDDTDVSIVSLAHLP